MRRAICAALVLGLLVALGQIIAALVTMPNESYVSQWLQRR